MSERRKSLLESLPDWAREALNPEAGGLAAAAAPAHDADFVRPLLLEAAVVCRFLPREIAPNLGGSQRAEAEKVLLSCSHVVHGPDGPRWMLAQERRVEILTEALASGELRQVLENARERAQSPVDAALVAALQGAAVPADLPSLEALRTAVAMLSGVRGITLPDLAELDREIELRRLLAVFERMVGRSGGRDRFFGRSKELEHLREYVGVIAAEGFTNIIKRGYRHVVRRISGRAPLCVWGVGGVGKTTLISKFMLEHAEAARSRFPFAYLDFDRTTVSARRKAGLLAEMCAQTGAQFSELAGPMASLRKRLEDFASRTAELQQEEVASALLPFTREFRTIIDRYLDASESAFEWARPFLLVFDTFEVVQYSDDDVTGMEQFVRGFSLNHEDGMWPRLRLILSGRKQVKNFLGPVEELDPPLGALDRGGSAELLTVLAEDAGRPVAIPDALMLVDAVVKASGQKKEDGLHPLRLRLIGELFRNSKISGPELIQSLIIELQEPRREGNIAVQTLIDGVLIRRVLGHVADPRVRALADPGLVVRRITPDVIQHVMTRGTTDPAAGEPEGSDTGITEPWLVSAEEARSIYDAFEHEVTLVDNEGDSLRHRPDVREQMLPLIRLRRPRRFDLLHQLAFSFFSARARENRSDLAAAAEAVYHGLWLGKPLSEIDQFWRKSPSFDPRIDAADFDEDSAACAYICAKTGSSLTPRQLRLLPREVAVEWLGERAPELLRERRIETSVAAVRAIAGARFELVDGRSSVAEPLSLLLYRTGRWNDVVTLCRRHLDTARQPVRTKMMRLFVTTLAKSGARREDLDRFRTEIQRVSDPEVAVEMHAHLAIAFMAAGFREIAAESVRLLPDLARQLDDHRWRRLFRVLRLWAVTGPFGDERPLRLWVQAREHVPRGLSIPLILRLLQLKGIPVSLDEVWRVERHALLGERFHEVKPLLWALAACDHSDWVRPMGNALTRAQQEGTINLADDGLGYVQFHAESGTLLQFAGDIARRAEHMTRSEYPSDIFSLAQALLHWHEAILKFAPPQLASFANVEELTDFSSLA